MKTLTERMNMMLGVADDAHVMYIRGTGTDYYGTLCLICAELDVNLIDVSEEDFDSCALVMSDFMESAILHTVSVWFDAEE